MDHIGILGIGLVGTAVAERLLAAGFRVTGYDTRPEQMGALVRLGGDGACCASDVAKKCERLILSLPTSVIVGTVIDEIQPSPRAGALLIDTTTGAPDDAVRFASLLSKYGIDYVD